ncbi:MAG: FAD-dependent thymidylate synthase [Candidatus Eremiobacteraeota bacterium]|nr:FAD-dependent thymidylate synthase [Candidatus Eremiobacteraeota bacterium]
MKVTLLQHTPEPEKLAAAAARVCYSSQSAGEIMEALTTEKIQKRISDCIKKGHLSIVEHVSFTFSIEEISRVTSHQLVRHRIASYSQQSQRYVKMGGSPEFVTPPRIRDDEPMKEKFDAFMGDAMNFYNEMVGRGIPCEDARYILPQALFTTLVVTMNARELLHFFSLRCCKKAQWEIRKLAYAMLRAVMKVAPAIFEQAGPSCLSGECPSADMKCYEKMSRLKPGGLGT